MATTIADIARATGKNRSTVSRVLRNASDYPVSEACRQQILQAAKRLNYVPRHSAQALATGKSYCVGAILGNVEQDLASPTLAPTLVAMTRTFLEHGYHLTLLPTQHPQPTETNVLEMVRRGRVDGFYIGSRMVGPRTLKELAKHRIPVVTTELPPELASQKLVNVVRRDDRPGMFALAQELVRRGHQRILYVIPTYLIQSAQYRHRVPLFLEAMRAAGLPLSEEDAILYYTPAVRGFLSDRTEARAAAERNIKRLRQYTAIVGTSDLVALGVADALRATGIEPGRDVALAGYDNLEENPNFAVAKPFLTTIDLDNRQRGRRIAELLLDRIRNPNAPSQTHTITTRLIVRQSMINAPSRETTPHALQNQTLP